MADTRFAIAFGKDYDTISPPAIRLEKSQSRFVVRNDDVRRVMITNHCTQLYARKYYLELFEVSQKARKAGAEKGVAMRDNNGDCYSLLHGFITPFAYW